MASDLTSESRRAYTILGLLGEGGMGRVYRARMSDGDFHKDVAIKMLYDRTPSDSLLARFRDEARILALVRDRATVSVEPPVKLGDAWCVVMDYVDGQSVGHLLHETGPLPPRVALEIVAEIARLLRNAYSFPGPTGEPLQLLHRDVKPGNIQVTRSGEVRLLDFGSARASFHAREAATLDDITGTPGFIAPERLDGQEGPEGDIYSLGVTLWCALTNDSQPRTRGDLMDMANQHAGDDMALAAALGLAVRMRERDPAARPSIEEVQNTATELANAVRGKRLADWCETIPKRTLGDDRLKGQRLTETLSIPANPSGRGLRIVKWLSSFAVGTTLLTLCVVLGIVIGAIGLRQFFQAENGGAPVVQPVVVPDGYIPAKLLTDPPGIPVLIDGEPIGVTPLDHLPEGRHSLELRKGIFSIQRDVDLQRGRDHLMRWRATQGERGWSERHTLP